MVIEVFLDYEKLEHLSYYDPKTVFIDLYHKDKFVEYVEVWNYKENEIREYIIINNESVYLDTIKRINE